MTEAIERLTGVAIIRDGKLLSMDKGSHSQLRGWKEREPNDVEGFLTSENRFVGRATAHKIGVEAGQVHQIGRELLSSDVTWEARPPAKPGNP